MRNLPRWQYQVISIVIALLVGCVGVTLVEIFDGVG